MKKITAVVFLIMLCFSVFSQVDITISEDVVIKVNQKFYAHKVESGQTLYSICKAYDVPQREVVTVNSLETSSLDTGQILYIPYKKIQVIKTEFYEHKVVEGETLFGISQKYGVSINEIIKYNPDARYGLKTDQIINIPQAKTEDNNFEEFYYHTVVRGNTLFSISQTYGVEISEIIKLNPGTENGIQTGQVLKISKSSDNVTDIIIENRDTSVNDINNYSHLYFEDENITPCKDFSYNKSITFNIVVMLPFYLNKNIYFLGNYKDEKDKMFYKSTGRFIEMYEGMFIALNDLKSKGISFKLDIYDTENNGSKVKEIMETLNYAEIDLIIGPVYSGNVKIASHYAKKHHINLISPLSENSDLILDNPFVYQILPSYETGIKNTSEMFKELRDSSFLFIHNGSEKEKEYIEIFKKKLKESLFQNDSTKEINLKIVDYSKGGREAIDKALIKGRENITIIPSNDEVFVTQVIDNLYAVHKAYSVKLIGSPRWELFQNINFDQLQTLSFQYISPQYIDYNALKVKNFITDFRSIYETEPSKFAFQGYDIINFFGQTLKIYGRHFQFCLSASNELPNHKGLIYNFNFLRASENGGFENNGTFFLEYDENYQMKPSKISQ